MNISRYVIYQIASGAGHAAGYIVNAIMWDGTTPISLPPNTQIALDDGHQYSIGGIYPASEND